MQEALVYIKNSFIEINNIITSLNYITLRKANVKPYGFDKMCMDMDKELKEDKIYKKVD